MRTKNNDKEKLYFLALIPPSPIHDEGFALKNYFKERYNSKASLNSPPHITLHMPFLFKTEKEQLMIQKLKSFVRDFDPFKICLDNFSSFPPRVIFINVTESEPLHLLQKEIQRFCKMELNLFNANYKDQPFHPHITLAFRDLKKQSYQSAWEEFSKREFKAEFIADKISLLKHNGKTWDVLQEFPLESYYSTNSQSRKFSDI
jgi:2'-5' RNA ligase